MPQTEFFKEMNKLATKIQKEGGKHDNGKGCKVYKITRAQAVKKASARLKGKKYTSKQVATSMGGSPSEGFESHEIAKDFLTLHNKSFAKTTIMKRCDNLSIAVKGKRGEAMKLVREGIEKIRGAAKKLKAGQLLPITISDGNRKILRAASKKGSSTTSKRKTRKKATSVAGISI